MNTFARLAVAAAAVVAVAVVGINMLPKQPGIGGGPSPTPTLSAPPSASPTALPVGGLLAPGTYVIGDPFRPQVSMDVTEGWAVWGGVSSAGAGIFKDSPDPPAGKAIVVTVVEEVFIDACDKTKGAFNPGPLPNDLAMALAGQPGTQAEEISDVTLSGYSGKHVAYTFDSSAVAGCSSLVRWPMAVGPRQAISDEHDEVWILDVDGVRLVVDAASFSGASAADHADMLKIVNSIQIEP